MKKTILTGLVICFTIAMNAQVITDSASNLKIDTNQLAQSYLTKSKNQKTGAWIILSLGAIATTAGVIATAHQLETWESPDDTTPVVLMASGGVVMLASIPLFISSKKNKRKAQLYLSGQHAMISSRVQPGKIYSVGLKMAL